MTRSHRSSGARTAQRGLTLVELMVGLTLGLIITAALLLLFANASTSGQNIARAGAQIENGRYVSELLHEDLRLAGFFGEASVSGAIYDTPNPCSTVPTGWLGSPYTLPAPVQGYAAADVLGCLADRKAGTDALVVRRLAVDLTDPATLVPANRQYHVQYTFCVTDVAAPRLIFDRDPAVFVLRNRACSAANAVRAYISRIYYVARCNRCTPGDTTPTLKRVDLVGDQLVTTALADGVEALRFEYGFDTDADGSADTYLTGLGAAGATAAWSNVMAVKAHFITRSLEKAVGSSGLASAQQFQLGETDVINTAADGYTRRAYSSTIRLINPSSVREVQ